MKCLKEEGLICVKNKLNIEFVVCKIEYIINEDDSFKYIFTPYYDVISLVDSSFFQGIPGIDLDLKKESYIRNNIIPTFISERVPQENREDYYDLLQEVNLEYMNPIKYLIQTKRKYSGDNLYVKNYCERQTLEIESIIGKSNSSSIIKIILENLAQGNKLYQNNSLIDADNIFFRTLLFIYEKSYKDAIKRNQYGINIAKKHNTYKGRKPLKIDELLFLEQLELLDKKEIDLKSSLRKLNISKATFYRIKKKYQKLQSFECY